MWGGPGPAAVTAFFLYDRKAEYSVLTFLSHKNLRGDVRCPVDTALHRPERNGDCTAAAVRLKNRQISEEKGEHRKWSMREQRKRFRSI